MRLMTGFGSDRVTKKGLLRGLRGLGSIEVIRSAVCKRDMEEGSPTPRQAPVPLPQPSKQCLSPDEERDIADAKQVRLDHPPASSTQASEQADTGFEMNDSTEDYLCFADDEADDVSGPRLGLQERLRLQVLIASTRRVFLSQSPGKEHTPGELLTPSLL